MDDTRKALNYDLDSNLLKIHYPYPNNYRYAWRQVKEFLFDNGFEDRQYSGVVSIEPMSVFAVQSIVEDLDNEFHRV